MVSHSFAAASPAPSVAVAVPAGAPADARAAGTGACGAPASGPDGIPDAAPPAHRRAVLCVTLNDVEGGERDARLRAMFRSALGVYVLDWRIERRCVKIRFDIAADDVDFMMHMLIRDLPEATIGPLEPRIFPPASH